MGEFERCRHRIGTAYAAFHEGVAATPIGGLPVVSVEHSFGSAAAGQAERAGAEFHTRILLGPIGMKDGWQADLEKTYVSYAAPNDLNRVFYSTPWGGGLASGELGYAVAPTPEHGIMTYDSGIAVDNMAGVAALKLVAPPMGIFAEAAGMLDNHNQIISTEDNSTVLRDIQRLLKLAAK